MKITLTPFFRAFLFALGYGCLFYLLQFFFAETAMLGMHPGAGNLRAWDVVFYESIARSGYDGSSNNTGFFILFPLLWKLTGLNIWGICVFNICCFATGFAFLSRALHVSDKVMDMLWLSLPSGYFFFLPYTEALFFLLGALLLYAVQQERPALRWCALFLLSLVRPTASLLIPAFIAMELFSNPRQVWLRSITRAGYRYLPPVLLALALFILWQYQATGIWFAYFKTQATAWGHVWSWPGIPFTNIAGGDDRYHWLSSLALLVDLLALALLIRQLIRWSKNEVLQDKTWILSAGYLAMLLFNLLFMNPKYGNQTSNIMGANRYTLAAPFFFVFLYRLCQVSCSRRQLLYVFLFLNAFWILFGAYHTFSAWYTTALINDLLIMAFLYWRSQERYSWLAFPIIAFNFFVQMHLFQQFITPLYVD